MNMRKVPLEDLSGEVRTFLAQVRPGEGIVVEDECGRAQYGVIPYTEASSAPELRQWALTQYTDEQFVAGIKEARTNPGQELGEVIREIEQELERHERTNP